jgi:hypothetical protein
MYILSGLRLWALKTGMNLFRFFIFYLFMCYLRFEEFFNLQELKTADVPEGESKPQENSTLPSPLPSPPLSSSHLPSFFL